jgi:hypothetical protein
MPVRTRFIKLGEPRRVMIRSSRCQDLVVMEEFLARQGLERVGILRFIKHILFWRKMK